ncbi:MAG: hypothetical protein Q7U04_07010 [Bacteriovorax sp.]|nr:hypothetical protein [Bacteriovorax sp.]
MNFKLLIIAGTLVLSQGLAFAQISSPKITADKEKVKADVAKLKDARAETLTETEKLKTAKAKLEADLKSGASKEQIEQDKKVIIELSKEKKADIKTAHEDKKELREDKKEERRERKEDRKEDRKAEHQDKRK